MSVLPNQVNPFSTQPPSAWPFPSVFIVYISGCNLSPSPALMLLLCSAWEGDMVLDNTLLAQAPHPQ